MRISTNMMYDAGVARLTEQQSALLKTQQQISSNRRLLTPSDDPVAAARALDLSQGQSVNAQYGVNRMTAISSLSLEESVLNSVTTLIQDVQTQTIAAGNASYDDKQRGYIATEFRSRLEELIGLANTRDGEGNYIFSGYKTASQPFAANSAGAAYSGDQGQRMLQVGTSRQLAISDAGDAVFENIQSSGIFAATSSTADMTVSALSVVNGGEVTGHDYDIAFSVSGGITTFTVTDATDSARTVVVSPSTDYTNPMTVTFDGIEFTISGDPDDGDSIAIRETPKQSLFKTLNDLIVLLETPTNVPSGNANRTHGLGVANTNLAHALDNILTVRASVGSRLKEIEALDSAGEDRDIQYASAISDLTDLDYIKAISDLTKQQITLEAAQKAFLKTTGLSLFDML